MLLEEVERAGQSHGRKSRSAPPPTASSHPRESPGAPCGRFAFVESRVAQTLPIPGLWGARREASRMGVMMRSYVLGALALAVVVLPSVGEAAPGPFR